MESRDDLFKKKGTLDTGTGLKTVDVTNLDYTEDAINSRSIMNVNTMTPQSFNEIQNMS